jgi:hypothetical protein
MLGVNDQEFARLARSTSSTAMNGEPGAREEGISLFEIHFPKIRQYLTAENEHVN